MARGKSVTKLLLDSSQSALFAGIEIHNKPHIDYRYPTSVILIINAWELALKAYVYKFINKKSIYEKNSKHTISFSKSLKLVQDDINKNKKKNQYKAVFENLDLLNDYRCSNVHFIESSLDPIIFMLISKAVLNYDQFLKDFFKKDITKDDNLIILPVGFRLPFNPVEYLMLDYGQVHNDFVNNVIQTVRELQNENVKDSIVIGFDVYTASVKKMENADIVAAIDNEKGNITISKKVQLTDDPNAPAMRLETPLLPLNYKELQVKIKEKRQDIKFGKIFNGIMKDVKKNPLMCQTRYLDPKIKSGTKKDFYSADAIDLIISLYDEEVKSHEL